MNQLLVVFNTCGISGKENVAHYIDSINSFLLQDFELDVVVSACKASRETKDLIESIFGNQVDRNYIEEVLPVNVTFNHTVLEAVKRRGMYDGYLYVDSGVTLDSQFDAVHKLYSAFKSGDFGMMSALCDTDNGIDLWFGTNYILDTEGDVCNIPVGKAINLHLQIFSNHLLQYYGKLMPDIFASYCTESTFSFLNAALQKEWGIFKNLTARHIPMMDGQSAGFSPPRWAQAGRSLIDHPFRVPSILPIMQGGYDYGLGYEECQGVLMHRQDKYDGNLCTDPNLKSYIKDNLFLSSDLLDYNNIEHTYYEHR